MGETEFLAKLTDILARAEGVNRATELPEDVLDSLALLSTIAAIDEEFGVTLPIASLSKCRSVGEILDLVAVAARTSP